MAVTWKKVAYESDVVTKAILTAQGDIIYASASATPAVLAIGTSTYVLTSNGTTPYWASPGSPGAHAVNHKDGGSDEILLHEFGEPTGAINHNGQQSTNFVIETSATPPAVPVVAKIYYDTDDSAMYICTSAA